MSEENHPSFIERKRPAVEGLIEDLIGPTARLDQLISSIPPLAVEEEPISDRNDSRTFQ